MVLLTSGQANRFQCFVRSTLAEDLGDGGDITSNAVIPVDAAIQANLKETVTRVLASLTPREERVLRMRFGIGMNTDHTLEEVGKQFDVTRERIRQIEAKAMKTMKARWMKTIRCGARNESPSIPSASTSEARKETPCSSTAAAGRPPRPPSTGSRRPAARAAATGRHAAAPWPDRLPSARPSPLRSSIES